MYRVLHNDQDINSAENAEYFAGMNFSVAPDGGASDVFILLSIGSTKNLPENFPTVIPLKLEVSDQAGAIPTTFHEFDLALTPNCEPDDLDLG